jgi:hypothetical protein
MNQQEPHNTDQAGELENLEQALLEGINSGPATEMTREDWRLIMERAKTLHQANSTEGRQGRKA